MEESLKYKSEFAKGTPSCFFVMSAYQFVCAIEAIYEFEIVDYKIIFVMNTSAEFDCRNEQMRKMAKQMNIEYEELAYNDISYDEFCTKSGLFATKENKRYERIFVCDYNAVGLLMLSVRYATPNAVLLYTDDGNSSISLFRGTRRDNRPSGWRQQLNWYKSVYRVQKRKKERLYDDLMTEGIKCTNSFFTIYNDIKARNFNLYPNTFQHLVKNVQAKKDSIQCIVIVGSALSAYAEQNRISIAEIEAITWFQLSKVREEYEPYTIIYIPHGRDTNPNVANFCQMLNIDYSRIEETIEYYLLRNGLQPFLVCGYNSTALLNIKKMFPLARIVNWFIDKKYNNSFYPFFATVRKYYEQNGIETDVIKYPSLTTRERTKMFSSNVSGLLKHMLKKLHLVK